MGLEIAIPQCANPLPLSLADRAAVDEPIEVDLQVDEMKSLLDKVRSNKGAAQALTDYVSIRGERAFGRSDADAGAHPRPIRLARPTSDVDLPHYYL
jgi:hypothetical protein